LTDNLEIRYEKIGGKMSLVAGIDAGSTTTKVVLMDENGVVAHLVVPTGSNCKNTAEEALKNCLEKINCERKDIRYIVSTGYGRNLIDFAQDTVSEISANAKGAKWLNTSGDKIRTIVDIGGQDSKVISLDDDGKIVNFAMNDKCAAGTGRFLEVMANVLEVNLEDFGKLSLQAKKILPINSTCTVFAESEVISLLARGNPVPDIIAGIHQAIARRVVNLAKRVGIKEAVFFDGGPALNVGLIKAMEDELGMKMVVPSHPQIVTAIGAALTAMEKIK